MRFLFIFVLTFSIHPVLGQEDTLRTQDLQEIRFDKDFNNRYYQALSRIRRTYPLAVYTKSILDSLDIEIATLSKKRKQKKLAKARKKELVDELEYLIKDLYVEEGVMLFKLIHRETGLTVTEILEKYRGKVYSRSVQATFSLWGHDTKSIFDAEGDDWIADLVVKEIEVGRIKLDMTITPMTKDAFKAGMKQYRANNREYKKQKRKK